MNLSVFFFVVLLFTLACGDPATENGRRSRRHRHRHRHRASNEQELGLSEEGSADSSGDEFVAAWRSNRDDDNIGSSGETLNSLEARLENLEDNVRYLCLEDEEDLERKIQALPVKCTCPKTEAPVCGSDNVTYYNRCYLHCRAKAAEMAYSRHKITLKKFGRC